MSASIQYLNNQPWSNLFEVAPSQFNVTCELQKEEFLKLAIINTCNDCIAWKLKTNRPGRYMVSPKQGIISAKQNKDCTVVLSKLKQVPDTKKPDKFLIQATKIDPNTQPSDLPQLWKDRESKHNKKGGIYAYQSVTIKCFLHVDNHKNAEPKKKNMTIIEDYVSTESANHQTPSKQNVTPSQTQQIQEAETAQQPPSKPPIRNIDTAHADTETVKHHTKDTDTANAEIPPSKPTKTDTVQYDPQTVEKWRQKAQEYDELFEFTQKGLTQKYELKTLLTAEREKNRSLHKINRDMKEEKKRILSEYNKYRNNQKHKNMMDEEEESEDEEKEETMAEFEGLTEFKLTPSIRRSQKQKDEIVQTFEEIEKEANKNRKSRCTISILQIIVTIFLMYLAFIAGKHHTNAVTESDAEISDGTEKHEM